MKKARCRHDWEYGSVWIEGVLYRTRRCWRCARNEDRQGKAWRVRYEQ